MEASADGAHVHQHLRSIILHSLDTFNFTNAEFASERLVALDSDNLDLIHLYCLSLYHQRKYKTVYSKLVELLVHNHLGCSFLFAKVCLHLEKFKEGVFQLLKLNFMYNETALDQNHSNPLGPFYFVSTQQKYQYELRRSVIPDPSAIYHLLGDLYKGMNDTKNSALNYSQALKYNQFDFEALQELCKLGVNVKVKAIYNQALLGELRDDILPNITPYELGEKIPNPFTNNTDTPVIHPDDSFTQTISTPRVKPTPVPDAPLRKSNLNTNSHFEFTKPSFPVSDNDKKHKSTYSRITSRLISQPLSQKDEGAKKTGLRNALKRTSSQNDSIATSSVSSSSASSSTMKRELTRSYAYLLGVYTIFAKAFKCFTRYDCYKAIRLLESLPEHEKETSAWVLSKLGRLHYEIVNYKQSEHFFVKLRMLDRTRLEDMEYYSTLLWHLHKKIELTYLCNELYDLDTSSPITWCAIGNLFSLTREPDEAIKCFNRATKLDKNFTYAYTLKGHEYFGNDNYEMALENFRISLLIDPRHYNAAYGIGMVCINLGDYHKADYHFRMAVLINPINIILICCVGMVLERLGKRSLALKQYELANKLQPLNPLPIFKKAQLLFAMQQFPKALKCFELLKELAPDEASVHFLLGQLYNIQGEKFLAIKEFTIALNLDPKGNYLIREAMEAMKE